MLSPGLIVTAVSSVFGGRRELQFAPYPTRDSFLPSSSEFGTMIVVRNALIGWKRNGHITRNSIQPSGLETRILLSIYYSCAELSWGLRTPFNGDDKSFPPSCMHVWALSWISSPGKAQKYLGADNESKFCAMYTLYQLRPSQYRLDSPFLRRITTSLARLLINIPGDGKTKAMYNLPWDLFQILCTRASFVVISWLYHRFSKCRGGWTSNLCRPSFKWLLYSWSRRHFLMKKWPRMPLPILQKVWIRSLPRGARHYLQQ